MIAIIVDNHAHRLLTNGAVESTQLISVQLMDLNSGKGQIILDTNWQILSPEIDLNMQSGDFEMFITKHLKLLHEIFPADRKPLPSSEKTEQVARPMNEPRI